MPRTRDPARLDEIVEAATRTFILNGYRLALMEQIAVDAGVSPATLYLYSEGKAALFELVVRRAFHDPTVDEVTLPFKAHRSDEPVSVVWQHVERAGVFPRLDRALSTPSPPDLRTEVEEVVRELYGVASRNRRGIKLVEKCAREWPELHAYYYRSFREGLIQRLVRWVEERVEGDLFRPMPDAWTGARAVLELVAWFAIHRFNAGDTSKIPEAAAEATVLQMVVNSLVPD